MILSQVITTPIVYVNISDTSLCVHFTNKDVYHSSLWFKNQCDGKFEGQILEKGFTLTFIRNIVMAFRYEFY